MYSNMKEIRSIDKLPEVNDRHITGYAAVFNSRSYDLGGFEEVITPNAFNDVIAKSDVLCLLDHNTDRGVLARSNKGVGSLTLSVDNVGLKYEFDAPHTALGDELLEGISRGDISQSSFAFTVADESWERSGDTVIRTINQIERLFDVSPVYHPAYSETSVDRRGLDKLIKEEEAPKTEKPTFDELRVYFDNLEKEFK